jgi:hypothetical protein
MKQTLLFCALLCGVAFTASATPYVIGDPYPGTNGDVIGDLSQFDIRQIRFLQLDQNLIQAEIDLNYDGGDLTLAQFQVGDDRLNIGDLLFRVGNDYRYGVALQTHSNSPNTGSAFHTGGQAILAGALYRINAGGVLTADDMLDNNCLTCYRPNEAVWMWNQNGTVTQLTNPVTTPVTVAHANQGNAAELLVRVSFVPDSTFMQALLSNQLSVHFASATCANDIIDGRVAVPEPGTWMMLGAGLIGLGLWRRKTSRG